MARTGGFNRKDPRFPTKLVALIRRVGSFEWKSATVYNLSSGGVGIRTVADFFRGDLIEMEIRTIDKGGVTRKRRVKGEIAWVKRFQYGVKFSGNGKKVVGK
jgi:hypothetical protein